MPITSITPNDWLVFEAVIKIGKARNDVLAKPCDIAST